MWKMLAVCGSRCGPSLFGQLDDMTPPRRRVGDAAADAAAEAAGELPAGALAAGAVGEAFGLLSPSPQPAAASAPRAAAPPAPARRRRRWTRSRSQYVPSGMLVPPISGHVDEKDSAAGLNRGPGAWWPAAVSAGA